MRPGPIPSFALTWCLVYVILDRGGQVGGGQAGRELAWSRPRQKGGRKEEALRHRGGDCILIHRPIHPLASAPPLSDGSMCFRYFDGDVRSAILEGWVVKGFGHESE